LLYSLVIGLQSSLKIFYCFYCSD